MRPGCLILTKRVPWYGAGSGYYSMLPEALRGLNWRVDTVTPRSGFGARIVGKFFSLLNGQRARHQALAFAEWEFLRRFDRTEAPSLILALEDHLPLLALSRHAGGMPKRLVGVIHYPPSLWTDEMLAVLGQLRSALILYRADIPFFERYVGRGRVAFVPHGVDVRQFTPAAVEESSSPRLLISGQFGRDFALLEQVFHRIRTEFPDVHLDVVGAHHARHQPALRRLVETAGVTVHGFVPDRELLQHYRRATLLLLPLCAAGANNALVEALACGLPIVATDTGGVRDYGGGSIFPAIPPGDVDGFVREVRMLLLHAERRRAVAAACRRFAEQQLSWSSVAVQHADALRQLIEGEPV